MSVGQLDTGLAGRLPLERIGKACRRVGVSQLWVHGPILEHDPDSVEEVEFLVEFIRRPAGRDLPGIELPHLCDMIRACSHSCRCLYTGEENRHGRVHRVL